MSERDIIAPPLQGKHILVTRTREQAAVLIDRLRALGATPVEFPTIRITTPLDWTPLDEAMKRLCAMDEAGDPYYSWLVFTSANGVRSCFKRLSALGYTPQVSQALARVRVAVIGPATAAALAQYGVKASLVPTEYIAEQVVAAMVEDGRRRGESLVGKRVLLARAAEARKVLVSGLQQAGATVDEVAAYRTVSAAGEDEQGRKVLRLLQDQQLDMMTFTSSSTVRHFMHWLADCVSETGTEATDLVTRNPQLKIACIGPITSRTARELGLDVHIQAKEFTIDGLVGAIVEHEG
jgi:uroporphyrinogen-III synthase